MEQTAQEIALSASREAFLASLAVSAASTAIVVVLIIILNKTVFNKNPASRPMAWGLAIVFFAVGFMTHAFVTAVAAELELLHISGSVALRSFVNVGFVSALALFWLIRKKEKKQPQDDHKVEGVTSPPETRLQEREM